MTKKPKAQPKVDAPTAHLTSVGQAHVQIVCPYCNGAHTHPIQAGDRGRPTRRAPGCAMHLSAQQRLTGYWIETPARKGN